MCGDPRLARSLRRAGGLGWDCRGPDDGRRRVRGLTSLQLDGAEAQCRRRARGAGWLGERRVGVRGLQEAGRPGLDRLPPTRPLGASAPSVSSGHADRRGPSQGTCVTPARRAEPGDPSGEGYYQCHCRDGRGVRGRHSPVPSVTLRPCTAPGGGGARGCGITWGPGPPGRCCPHCGHPSLRSETSPGSHSVRGKTRPRSHHRGTEDGVSDRLGAPDLPQTDCRGVPRVPRLQRLYHWSRVTDRKTVSPQWGAWHPRAFSSGRLSFQPETQGEREPRGALGGLPEKGAWVRGPRWPTGDNGSNRHSNDFENQTRARGSHGCRAERDLQAPPAALPTCSEATSVVRLFEDAEPCPWQSGCPRHSANVGHKGGAGGPRRCPRQTVPVAWPPFCHRAVQQWARPCRTAR